jgi:allantoinase
VEREALWQHVLGGDIDWIASDHSPSSPDLKSDADFFRIWGGIAGVQSTLPALLEAGHHARSLSLRDIVRMTAQTPAERFRLAGKGRIAKGFDADLALVDLGASFTLTPEDLHQRHALSPYIVSQFRGRVTRTLLRGQTIFHEGRITADANGKWVRPLIQESACTS